MDETTKAVYEYMKRNSYFIQDFVTNTEPGYINSNTTKDLRDKFEHFFYQTTFNTSDDVLIALIEKGLDCVNWREINEVIQSTDAETQKDWTK